MLSAPLPSQTERSPLHQLALRGDRLLCHSGETLFSEGDAGDALYLVVEGRVELHRAVEGAWRHPVGARAAGDLLGLLSVMDGAPRGATAITAEDCVLVRVPAAALFALIESDPALGNALLNRICQVMAERLEAAQLG